MMDQLNTLDAAFLGIESDIVSANIGGISIFPGPAPTHEEMITRIESKLVFVPRYRQKLKFLPMQMGRPLWIDDQQFDIRNHLLYKKLPAGSGMQEVSDLFGDMIGRHLDRTMPLWAIWIVDGIEDGKWALFWSVHHAMVDGVAATDIMSLMLDMQPDPEPTVPEPWVAQDEPGTGRVIAESVAGALKPVTRVRDLSTAIREPAKTGDKLVSTLRTLAPLGKSMVGAQDSPLNGPIGLRRRWACTEIGLTEVKAVSKRLGVTINDTVLAAVTGGLAGFLKHRGEAVTELGVSTLVPVSVRATDESGKMHNHVSAVFVELPIAEDDPLERLEIIRDQMAEYKEKDGAGAGTALTELVDFFPPALFAIGEKIIWRVADTRSLMNTVTTNVPGPQFPVYCLGRKMEKFFPYVMLAKNVRVATAIFSYDGNLYFGVTGDWESVPDLNVVCQWIDQSLADLIEAAEQMPDPTVLAN